MNVLTEGSTMLPAMKKVVARTARSFAQTIIVGRSVVVVCISCQQQLELQFAPNRFRDLFAYYNICD